MDIKVLILGGDGMLGHRLFLHLKNRVITKITLRHSKNNWLYKKHNYLCSSDNAFHNINVNNVEHIINTYQPDYVINCIGVIKQNKTLQNNYIANIEINALFPHKLAEICNKNSAKLITFSTDCVFSGMTGNYSEESKPDPVLLYDQVKLLGEIVNKKHCLTIRSSFIGLELKNKQSLIEWFLSQTGTIQGFTKAIYSGVTTLEMARIIDHIITKNKFMSGVWHVASRPISKYEILSLLQEKINKTDIIIEKNNDFSCNRSLLGNKFEENSGYKISNWNKMLDELASEIKTRENLVKNKVTTSENIEYA
ncbi:MAG: SDR family oxidoreductase [Romboutsia sp.]|nr:SDR family oxidoreductase [Romboutsia sp.]